MKKYLFTALVAVVGVVALTVANTDAAVTVGNQGNGADTYNYVKYYSSNKNSINQSNNAVQSNSVNVKQNSGYNNANKNTGGDVNISTGATTATVGVANTANTNVAGIAGCGCEDDVLAGNSGNGADSTNKVKVSLSRKNKINQSNLAIQGSSVNVKQNSGKNNANSNTGSEGSDPAITTGPSTVDVVVENAANQNEAVIGLGL